MSISNKIFGVLNSIHFETELLEALDWDELKLNETIMKLNDYLSVTTKTDLDLLKVDLGYFFLKISLMYNFPRFIVNPDIFDKTLCKLLI